LMPQPRPLSRLSRRRLVSEWAGELVDAARRTGTAVIVAHRNADPDAVGAALLVGEALALYRVKYCVLLPEGASAQSRALLARAGVGVPACNVEMLSGPDLLVVVDSASHTQLGDAAQILDAASRVILVDHHEPGPLHDIVDAVLGSPAAGSSTEVAAVVLEEMGACPEPAVASIALHGIVHDTRRFSSPGVFTFEAAQYLVDCGGRVLARVQRPREQEDFSERYARVVGASRARVSRACRDIIVAVTHIGSFESRVASSLVDLGADVAVAVKDEGRGFRAAVRVSDRAVSRGITANAIAEYLASKFGGQGGGHARAGMAHLPPALEEAEDLAERIARSLPGRVARMCREAGRE